LPKCGYVGKYDIKSQKGQILVSVVPVGYIDVCNLIGQAFIGCKSAVIEDSTSFLGNQVIAVTGKLPSVEIMEHFLGLLSKCITAETTLDEYHALGPYTTPLEGEDDTEWLHTWVGRLLNKAKYGKDENAATRLAKHLENFIKAHPRYARAKYIIPAPPSGKGGTLNFSRFAADYISNSMKKTEVIAYKSRETTPHKELWESASIDVFQSNIANSMKIGMSLGNSGVILLDDTSRSCATLEELGRACRKAAASEVLGLTAARDAKYTYGIDISEGPWHEQ